MKVFFKNNENEFKSIEADNFRRNNDELFRVVNYNTDPISFDGVIKIADETGYDILMINEKVEPKIVKVLDMQKFMYELKKAKKESEKRQKAQREKVKEIRISLNISEHDLDIKVNHAKEFIDEGCKVKFVLRLQGREGQGETGKKYAEDFFNSTLEKFNGYHISEIKTFNNIIFVEITKG